ncbi:MAG TPA: electron transfer flavoprotein subunit beta/FixA family protein [Eubacteriales bacterium]|mgnify:CR=1 FL=1|nr:electron transfer flavoprotein subunit beta/FixA family protein [Clostridia bacterium]HRV73655.1 electron transfer flavoprotein subunit beta/FixA family protein [Eubacteriales bacterium]
MRIICCIKQVPDTTEVKLDPVKGTLIRDGVPSIINPDDKAGLEAALRIKEQIPGSTVTIVSMGPPQADVALREALAMGADDAYLITDRKFGGADTWATSYTIAVALKMIGFDLIVCGRQAIDGDTAQVGPQIARHLEIPQVSYVEEVIDASEEHLVLKRQFEDRYHVLEVGYPCLITALGELNKPRYMSVSGIIDAYQKQVHWLTYADMKDNIDDTNIGLLGSPTRVKQSFTKQPKGKGEKFEVEAEEAVDIIVSKLAEKHII